MMATEGSNQGDGKPGARFTTQHERVLELGIHSPCTNNIVHLTEDIIKINSLSIGMKCCSSV